MHSHAMVPLIDRRRCPAQVRKLAVLVAMGKRVYVHCTAGINRATLTAVGYLTFVEVCRVSSLVCSGKDEGGTG